MRIRTVLELRLKTHFVYFLVTGTESSHLWCYVRLEVFLTRLLLQAKVTNFLEIK